MHSLYYSNIVILVLGLLSSVAIAPQALAQTTSTDANPTGVQSVNWIVSCNNRENAKILNCAMSQTLLDSKSRQRIASASIVKQANGFALVLSLPHGLDLASGVQLSVDGGPRNRHAFQTADSNGVYSRIGLDTGMVEKLKTGNELILSVTSASKKDLDLKMSLVGFSDSFSLLSQ